MPQQPRPLYPCSLATSLPINLSTGPLSLASPPLLTTTLCPSTQARPLPPSHTFLADSPHLQAAYIDQVGPTV